MRTRIANVQVIQIQSVGGGMGERRGQLHSDADTHTCIVKHRHRGKLTKGMYVLYCIISFIVPFKYIWNVQA